MVEASPNKRSGKRPASDGAGITDRELYRSDRDSAHGSGGPMHLEDFGWYAEPEQTLQPLPRKGRGAASNRAGRYEAHLSERVDDGWRGAVEEPEPLVTSVTWDASRSVIARNQSPDVPFERSINPYRGCEHGCIYCFARPSHAWLGLSPGLDFESRIFAKSAAAALLEEAFSKPGYKADTIVLGANTDPYQPVERKLGITRDILDVMLRWRHPVNIVTKSHLVCRDLDLLGALAKDRLVSVNFSVTSLDSRLSRLMEPRAPTPARRLEAMARLAEAGIPVGCLAAPMIPAINDSELEAILEASEGAGARSAGYLLLRLPLEIKELFIEWLDNHFPERKNKVLSQIRDMRGGRLYDSTFGRRMTGEGVYADLLKKRFESACRRLNLGARQWHQANRDAFRKPLGSADQPSLFDS